MARLKLITLNPLSTTVYAPVVYDTIPVTTPTTIVVTAATTTGFCLSSGFAYPFGHPYGPPHGYQGFINQPELTQGFPIGAFGPYGPYGPQPLVSHPLTLQTTMSQVFVPQYYGANPYGAQLSMTMGNHGYTISPVVMVTYPLQEDPADLYHGPSIHSDTTEDEVQGQIQALSKKLNTLQAQKSLVDGRKRKEGYANAVSHHRPSNRRQQHQPAAQEAPAPQVQQPMPVNMITEDENLIMDVMKVKTPLMPVHLKLFKVSGKKMNDEVSVIVSVIMSIFNKPKAFKIFCPPRESTPPANSAKRLDIKMPAHFPYKSDKVVLWGYETTIIVNGVEKPLFNNKVVTNIADTSGLTRSGRVFTLANLRGGKTVAEKLDNGKAPLVIPESIPIQDSAKAPRTIQVVKLIFETFRSGGFMD
ncbi:hypothetical protein KIW84_065199 [Lathyrus oleraceus]|uniref:Uncharacterized protein n=1 Tax=Pisum sativum TaxID=3888 RepID=A0A9D5A9A3_PEA|nr:hypothetical protein KIW84_065199 [Pisum sativum]